MPDVTDQSPPAYDPSLAQRNAEPVTRERLARILRDSTERGQLNEQWAIDAILAAFPAPGAAPVAPDPRVDPLSPNAIEDAFLCLHNDAAGEMEYVQNYGKDAATVRAVVIARALGVDK